MERGARYQAQPPDLEDQVDTETGSRVRDLVVFLRKRRDTPEQKCLVAYMDD
eukprot:gene19897-14482_t